MDELRVIKPPQGEFQRKKWEERISRLVLYGAEGVKKDLTSVSTSTTLNDSHWTVLVDASGGAVTITLPAAADHKYREYNIKKIDSSAYAVTVDGNGSETIDGATTQVISAQWDCVTVHCNGTAWFVI